MKFDSVANGSASPVGRNVFRRVASAFTYPHSPDSFAEVIGAKSSINPAVKVSGGTSGQWNVVELRLGRLAARMDIGDSIRVVVSSAGVRHAQDFVITDKRNLGSSGVIETWIPQSDLGPAAVAVSRAVEGERFRVRRGGTSAAGIGAAPILLASDESGLPSVLAQLRRCAAMDLPPAVLWLAFGDPHCGIDAEAELDRYVAAGWLARQAVPTKTTNHARINPRTLGVRCPDWVHRTAFVAGSQHLIDSAIDTWATNGATDQLFVGAVGVTNESDDPHAGNPGAIGLADTVSVELTSTDVTLVASPVRSLLETMEGAGVEPKFGCRRGICHTCVTTLESGCVRNADDGRLSEGTSQIRICVSQPLTDCSIRL